MEQQPMAGPPPGGGDLWDDVEAPPVTPPRRRRLDDEMDITPMIDMTFLLLIFFLVAAKMESPGSVALPPARYGTPVSAKNSVVLLVSQAAGGRVVVSTGHGQPLPAADLLGQEARITGYVEAGLSGLPPFEAAKQHVLIKAERSVKHREVARVARAAGRAGRGQQLYIAVLEVQ